MEQKKETVTVQINGVAHACSVGTSLGALLPTVGAGHMPCGGHGRCGKCRVTVTGEISPPDDTERRKLSVADLEKGVRLACRVTVWGDCTVTTEGDGGSQIRTDGALPAMERKPGFARYGAAVDIGTTTLAAHLYDGAGNLLATVSRLNPQSAWGADVISRMEAALAGNAVRIAGVTRRAVNGMLVDLAATAGIAAKDIDGLTVTGNTVMLHLLTASDVEPLTHAPFAAERLFGESVTARALELTALAPDTGVYFPPCVAAFVGADTVTALLASELCHTSSTALLCDIGTNGEMVLWHDRKLRACSTAAGPAFEGAGISMGMGGRAGAVDRVWTEDGKLCAHVIGEIDPIGLCGSGLVDAVACLLEVDALDETGYLEDDPAVIAPPVTVNQADIRAVQLAKSAIHAGMRTLLHAAGLTCEGVDTLFIAGGFGSYLDVNHAGKIGLLPEELTDRVLVLGNAALTGAAMLLLNTDFRLEAETLARRTELVELAANPVFASEYMERMMF